MKIDGRIYATFGKPLQANELPPNLRDMFAYNKDVVKLVDGPHKPQNKQLVDFQEVIWMAAIR